MAYKRISPVPIVEGGTGAQTLGLNGVLLGNTLSAITSTTAGTTGQVLTGVTGSPPTFQSPAASSITITGDSGGGLTGNSFTFTGSTTGLTFSGSGSTETLGGTLIVANGGTGAATLTSHGVLLGNTTSAITATTVGTTGQVLTGVTGSAPTFQAPAASSIIITGDTGGALTGAAFTLTGGTTGLTFAGASTTETLGGTLIVANGGTGRATLTNHGLLIGAGTTAITQSAVGATGTVLIGNSAADPTFSATPVVTSIGFGGSALSTFTDWTSWTPTVQGVTTGGTTTYTNQVGTYSRIGNILTLSFTVSYSAATGTGVLAITSLPFAINSLSGYIPTGSVILESITFPATTTFATLYGSAGNAALFIYASGTAVGGNFIQMANSASTIVGTITYRV